MRKRNIQAITCSSAAMLMMTAAVACGQQDRTAGGTSAHASPDTSVYASKLQKSDLPWSDGPSPYNAEIELDDGRRVAMHYSRGKGLLEQHYSPRAKAWTKPVVIHRTKVDACQGIELRAKSGTVAAIADFGYYCYDGEPPSESIAAVGTGNLTKWDINVTRDFDGWERVSVSDNGQQVTFWRDTILSWSSAEGFDRQ